MVLLGLVVKAVQGVAQAFRSSSGAIRLTGRATLNANLMLEALSRQNRERHVAIGGQQQGVEARPRSPRCP
ncbi:MAG: hypothetical protein MZV64_34645 [Ignavibacteriales bacterium]|nr:hypothetical protein [Ignavibacteriales bacterium]